VRRERPAGGAWGSVTADDRILAVLPLHHGFGMSITMNAPMVAGAEIVLLPRFQPARCWTSSSSIGRRS
jgi:acyl-CoA synthetase (AMP-forming)/AMP-acid ligase II